MVSLSALPKLKSVCVYKLCTKFIINQSKTFIEGLDMVWYGTSWYMVGYCTYLVDKCPYLDDQVDKCTSVAGNKGGSCKDSFIILHF